ncbi:hypothetical protein Hypma_004486 [Hypsizygus marmoreus]|uniref:Uncharacterized protein n=1 Tax=Hypsizygus marmoreus TaxID=39966 RepID=A0A369K3M4_HYPMA|nr:hypothetical protein Hypma_004486 [Hypsizygus marmoreus]
MSQVCDVVGSQTNYRCIDPHIFDTYAVESKARSCRVLLTTTVFSPDGNRTRLTVQYSGEILFVKAAVVEGIGKIAGAKHRSNLREWNIPRL